MAFPEKRESISVRGNGKSDPVEPAVWLEDHFQSWIGDLRRNTLECWTALSTVAEALVSRRR